MKLHLPELINPKEIEIYKRVYDRALVQNQYQFEPYSCYIEYREKDPASGLEYRDCTIDYTKCTNYKCIKKLT